MARLGHPDIHLAQAAVGKPSHGRLRQTRQDRKQPMGIVLLTVLMLIASNVFMTFAWYGHLKDLKDKPWLIAAMVSWCIAFFEYLIQVPANRIGSSLLSLPQLKILQEVITLCVFVPFMVLYMKQPLRWDFLWAALCMCGAVYFIFREGFIVLPSAEPTSIVPPTAEPPSILPPVE
jgi:uncharacterized protein (DUF486 family)